MKSIYEKTKKLSEYIIDLMYMQRYYLDVYDDINIMYTGGKKVVKKITYDKLRSYHFVSQDSDAVFNSIQYDDNNFDKVLMTITGSKHHINNNTGHIGVKYNFIQHPGDKLRDKLKDDLLLTFDLLSTSIEEGTQKETEFQVSMMYNEHIIKCLYLYIMCNEHLNKIQVGESSTVLCLTSTDVLRYIPARKAYIEVLDKKVKHDWRSEIKDRYGRTIK